MLLEIQRGLAGDMTHKLEPYTGEANLAALERDFEYFCENPEWIAFVQQQQTTTAEIAARLHGYVATTRCLCAE
jgi:hypothetical protein